MEKIETPNPARPRSPDPEARRSEQAARDRRVARAFEGWLASRIRSGAARRRAAAGPKRGR